MHFRTIDQPIEELMATIKANGGAASVWERTGHHSDGMPYTLRVVLCRNGKVLTGIGTGTYHHAQAPKLAALAGQPLDTQELTLRHLGFARATSDASVRASTTVAAHWHRQAKHARAIRRASH
jgi:hypothetical protein